MERLRMRRKVNLKGIEMAAEELAREEEEEDEEEEEEEEPLSPGSRMFHEPGFDIHILAVMGSKTPISVDVVKEKLPLTLLKHPRFCSLVMSEYSDGGGEETMKWVRTEVVVEDHIIIPEIELDDIIKLASSSSSSSSSSPELAGDKFVEEYIHSLTKTTLDKSRPLWDLHLLQVKTSEAEAVSILRIHHSIGDGVSLMSLLLACTRQTADPTALPTIPGNNNNNHNNVDVMISSSSSRPSKLLQGLRWFMVAVWWAVQLSWNTAVDVMRFLATSWFLKDTFTPFKGPATVELRISPTPRRIIHKTVDLDDFKLIKNAMDATINDVALGITQAGLSRYLNRIYEVDGKNNGDEEPSGVKKKDMDQLKNIRLRATLLMNIRPATGIQALADMMEKDTKARWGNCIGCVLLPFNIGLRDDPLDYVREAKAIVDRKKHSLEAICTFYISQILLNLFGAKFANAVSHRIFSNTTMSFSNMVGPLEEIGFYGHPMAFIVPSCYGQPHGLMIHLQSYINKMTIVLSVAEDSSVQLDPHQLCDDIVESLKLVKDAVISRSSGGVDLVE